LKHLTEPTKTSALEF